MSHRTTEAMVATPAAGVLLFPQDPDRAPSAPRPFVQTSPAPGGQLRMTYVDADLEPRIELTVDPSIDEDSRAMLKRAMKLAGDRLPLKASRPPLLGPRLVPGVLALAAGDFFLQLLTFA